MWRNRRRMLGLLLAAVCVSGCGGQEQPREPDMGAESQSGEEGQLQEGQGEEETQVPRFWEMHTREEMIGADYLLYEVNCAGAETGELGVYQSGADQEYGTDQVTGKQWGYRPADYLRAVEDDSGDGLTASRWEIGEDADYKEETGFYYDFEVPAGEYEVTLGFYNPFSARTLCVDIEGKREVDALKILKYKLTETQVPAEVTDGSLEIKVYNPDRGTDAMKDPILSYIVVRAVPEYDGELLDLYLEETQVPEQYADRFTRKSYEAYQESREAALALVSQKADTEQYREVFEQLMTAY